MKFRLILRIPEVQESGHTDTDIYHSAITEPQQLVSFGNGLRRTVPWATGKIHQNFKRDNLSNLIGVFKRREFTQVCAQNLVVGDRRTKQHARHQRPTTTNGDQKNG